MLPSEESLFDLLDELRSAGLGIGTEHYIQAQELRVSFEQGARSQSDLLSWLAPLLCSSPSDLETFSEVAESWSSRSVNRGRREFPWSLGLGKLRRGFYGWLGRCLGRSIGRWSGGARLLTELRKPDRLGAVTVGLVVGGLGVLFVRNEILDLRYELGEISQQVLALDAEVRSVRGLTGGDVVLDSPDPSSVSVTGVIVDEDGQPLEGAQVEILGALGETRSLELHLGPPLGVGFQGSNIVAVGSEEGRPKVVRWNPERAEPETWYLEADAPRHAELFPDASSVILSSEQGEISLFDIGSSQSRWRKVIRGQVLRVASSPLSTGRAFLVVSWNRGILSAEWFTINGNGESASLVRTIESDLPKLIETEVSEVDFRVLALVESSSEVIALGMSRAGSERWSLPVVGAVDLGMSGQRWVVAREDSIELYSRGSLVLELDEVAGVSDVDLREDALVIETSERSLAVVDPESGTLNVDSRGPPDGPVAWLITQTTMHGEDPVLRRWVHGRPTEATLSINSQSGGPSPGRDGHGAQYQVAPVTALTSAVRPDGLGVATLGLGGVLRFHGVPLVRTTNPLGRFRAKYRSLGALTLVRAEAAPYESRTLLLPVESSRADVQISLDVAQVSSGKPLVESVFLGVAVAVATTLGVFLLALGRPRAVAERADSTAQDDAPSLALAQGGERELIDPHVIDRISQVGGVGGSSLQARLDVEATVRATAEAAGHFKPIHEEISSDERYLALIDARGAGDHQALLVLHLLETLASRGFQATCFTFHSDPRVCRSVDSESDLWSLSRLAAKYSEHSLLIFCNPEQCCDLTAGGLQPWVKGLESFRSRAILDPQPGMLSGELVDSLTSANISVVPSTPEGVERLLAGARHPEREPREPHSPILLERPLRWLDEAPPPEADQDRLCVELIASLGFDDFNLLAACAVYPILDWPLTILLLRALDASKPLEARFGQLLRFSRLPWFRVGWMPDWLRSRLLRELPVETERSIRSALRLHIGAAGDDALRATVRPRGLRWRAAGSGVSREIGEDRVFVGFMMGSRGRGLDVELRSAPVLRLMLGAGVQRLFGIWRVLRGRAVRLIDVRVGRLRDKALAPGISLMSSATDRRTLSRVYALGLLGVAIAAVLGGRAIYLAQPRQGRDNVRASTIVVPPVRGEILDRDGRRLAVSVEAPSVYIDSGFEESSILSLSRALELDEGFVRGRFESMKNFSFIQRWASEEAAERVQSLGIPGVGVLREPRRMYPEGTLAGSLVGFANIDGDGVRGIEQAEDNWLRGRERRVLFERDARGKVMADEMLDPRQWAGGDVQLTLDLATQRRVVGELSKLLTSTRSGGAVGVVLGSRSEVTALAQAPSFDPNRFRSTSFADTRAKPFLDSHQPGMSLLPVFLAIGLEKGVLGIDALESFDPEDPRTRSTARVLARRLGPRGTSEGLREAGFGRVSGSGFPGESAGILRPWEQWRPIDLDAISAGFGINVTPIQLASALSALVGGGVQRSPELVLTRRRPGGQWQALPQSDSRRVVSEGTSQAITRWFESRSIELIGGRYSSFEVRAEALSSSTGEFDDQIFWSLGVVFGPSPTVIVLQVTDPGTGVEDALGAAFRGVASRILESSP